MEGLGVLCCCGGFFFVLIALGAMRSGWRRLRGGTGFAVGQRPLGWHKRAAFKQRGFGGSFDTGLGKASYGKAGHGKGGFGAKPAGGGWSKPGGSSGKSSSKGGGAKSKW